MLSWKKTTGQKVYVRIQGVEMVEADSRRLLQPVEFEKGVQMNFVLIFWLIENSLF